MVYQYVDTCTSPIHAVNLSAIEIDGRSTFRCQLYIYSVNFDGYDDASVRCNFKDTVSENALFFRNYIEEQFAY